VYCEDCDIAEIDESSDPSFRGGKTWDASPSEAERLWLLSASQTGIDAVSKEFPLIFNASQGLPAEKEICRP